MENNKFYRIIRRIIKPITNCLWPVKIINANKFVEGKGIYVCNHFTMLDPVPFVTDLFEYDFNALMKEESLDLPIIGKILPKIGVISIKRGEADLRAIKKCMDVLKNNQPLIVFPEGTRNKTGNKQMLEFKDGVAMFALKTKSPIIPMIYSKPIKTFRKTYLLIGDPMYLDEFYGEGVKEARSEITNKLKLCMENLQAQLEEMLLDKKALKKLLKAQKIECKQIRKQNKLEYKKQQMLAAPKEEK